MANTYMGFNISTRGLFVAQRGLSVVEHNIANVNTPGYSRQIINQTASQPKMAWDGTGMIGTGADVNSVSRIRDEYLDYKYWNEVKTLGEWETKNTMLSDLEAVINEPSDNGFSVIMDDFYSSLQELSKDPGSLATRAAVVEYGVSLTKYFNNLASNLENLQNDINTMIKAKVKEVNSIASQIQQLNKQIYESEVTGDSANDLRDQRIVLVDKLSKIVNVEAYEYSNGKLPGGREDMHFAVIISGKPLVDHFDRTDITYETRDTKLNEEDVENLYELGWADGNKLKIRSGELRGYLDVRDGNDGEGDSPDFRGIPHYQKKLNEFVRVFARTFNEGIIDDDGDGVLDQVNGHAQGYTLDSTNANPITGIRFFTMEDDDGNVLDSSQFINGADLTVDDPMTTDNEHFDSIISEYDKITAKNFSLSQDIIDDIANIATADLPDQEGNINVLNSIIDIRNNTYMFNEGAPEDFVKTIVASIGVDNQLAAKFSSSQGIVINQVKNNRASDSGVSINEEMTLMVKYQHAYNASAKMINTMSEIFDIMINGLGI